MRYVLTMVLVYGCAGEDPLGDSGVPGEPPEEACRGSVMEDDFAVDGDLPPPESWPPMPPDATVSTTYLQLMDTPEAQQAFGESVGPIAAVLESMPGLMGLSFASSEACGTQRTLSVWASEADMMGFVTSPQHAAAMARIGDISRGESMTMSWTVADLDALSWAAVVSGLGAHGPGF